MTFNEKPVLIRSRDYWFKTVANQQVNWALFDEDETTRGCTVFFFSDTSFVFDRLSFLSVAEATQGLCRNGFTRVAEDKEVQQFLATPRPPFHEGTHPNGPIYSAGRFWRGRNTSKRKAMAAVNVTCGLSLSNSTTHFANVNASKAVWWLDIPVKKFTSGQYRSLDLLLVSEDQKLIHHLRVPTSDVIDNLLKIRVRTDKESVSLELSSQKANIFQDMRSGGTNFQFKQYLVNSIPI